MKRLGKYIVVIFVGLMVLVGCSAEEEFESFSLMEISGIEWEDEETPTNYMVNYPDRQGQVMILRNEMISEAEFSKSEGFYDLDHVSVTDEEIIIEYEGKIDTFKRLSESVVENEDKVRYQYIGASGEE